MKTTFLSKLKYIEKHHYTKFVVRFLKINIFHIFIECLITIYMLAFSVLFSRFFLFDPRNLPTMIIFLVMPIIIVTITSIVFGVVCTFVFVNKVYKYSKEIENSRENNILLYNKITNKYKTDIKNAHAIGTVFYAFTTSIIPFVLTKLNPNLFVSTDLFILVTGILGTFMGILWNISGVYRNLRVNWCQLVRKFDVDRIKEENQKLNFNCFKNNLIWSIISVIVIVLWEITVIILKHPVIDLSTIIKDYNFILLTFTALYSLYIKTFVQKLFMCENESEVFTDLKTIINMYK